MVVEISTTTTVYYVLLLFNVMFLVLSILSIDIDIIMGKP